MSRREEYAEQIVRVMVRAWDECGRSTRLRDDGAYPDDILALHRIFEMSRWWNPKDRIMFGILRHAYEVRSGHAVRVKWGYPGRTQDMTVVLRGKV